MFEAGFASKAGVARRRSMKLIDLLKRRADLNVLETPLAVYVTKVPGAEEAYLHTIHKPADPEILATTSRDLEFPPSLVAHFEQCNGGSLFCASVACIGINLFGCLPKGRSLSRALDQDSPPIDIRTSNRGVREHIAFASYGYDTSLVLVNMRNENVRCCHGRDIVKTRREWPSIDDWLTSELDRLSQVFAPDGTCLVTCEELVPLNTPVS